MAGLLPIFAEQGQTGTASSDDDDDDEEDEGDDEDEENEADDGSGPHASVAVRDHVRRQPKLGSRRQELQRLRVQEVQAQLMARYYRIEGVEAPDFEQLVDP